MNQTRWLSLLLVTIGIAAVGSSAEFPLSRIKDAKSAALTQEELSSRLPCDPVLISRRVEEVGFAKEFKVSYAGYEFTRTDVGDPDGWLTITYGKSATCRIQLSLDEDLYFSVKNKLVVLAGTNGSTNTFEAFDLQQDCTYLGSLKVENSDDITHLLDSDDESRVCKESS